MDNFFENETKTYEKPFDESTPESSEQSQYL